MNYCTHDDILKEISESKLVELTSDGDTVDWGVVDQAIEDASNLIDSYIGQRYSLPLGSIPQVLRKVCVDIAIYEIYAKRLNEAPGYDFEDMPVVKRYKDAMQWLKDVVAGKAGIYGADESGNSVDIEQTGGIYSEAEEAKF